MRSSLFLRSIMTVVCAALVTVSQTNAAQAEGFLCQIFCKKEPGSNGGVRSDADISSDPTIADSNLASQAVNSRFQFFKLSNATKQTGYVRIEYAFVGKNASRNGDGEFYDLNNPTEKSFFERSIIDWARSLFKKDERTFLVTLTAKTLGGDTLWIEPVIAFKYEDGFNLIKIADSLKYNGSSTFYRPFDEEVEITIDVVSAKTSTIDTSLVASVFDASGQLAGVLGGPVFSAADIMAVAAYRTLLNQLKDKLSKFESSIALTRKAVFKYENDRWFGFQYYFVAPTVNYSPFKLNVNLAFKKSLLEDRIAQGPNNTAVLASAAVLNQMVKPPAANAQTLSAYFSSSPISTDVQTILAKPEGSGAQACTKIGAAASAVFQPHDVALAKLAFIQENIAAFEGKKTPLCFQPIDRLHLANYRLAVPDGFEGVSIDSTVRKLTPISKYFITYLKSLSILIKYTQTEATADLVDLSKQIVLDQARDNGSERAIQVTDSDGIFLSGTPRNIYPSDLATALLAKSYDKAGCYERTIYSDASDPNVVGILFAKGTDTLESVVHFSKTPPSDPAPAQIKIDSIEFRKATAAILALYKTAYGGKACRSGWTPW